MTQKVTNHVYSVYTDMCEKFMWYGGESSTVVSFIPTNGTQVCHQGDFMGVIPRQAVLPPWLEANSAPCPFDFSRPWTQHVS